MPWPIAPAAASWPRGQTTRPSRSGVRFSLEILSAIPFVFCDWVAICFDWFCQHFFLYFDFDMIEFVCFYLRKYSILGTFLLVVDR